MSSQDQPEPEHRPFIRETLIGDTDRSSLKCLKAIDIFAFIPVPKDSNVSTKPSLIGSIIFFTLFLSYFIYDFVQFVINNPPVEQIYRTLIDFKQYQLPQFAIAFMYNQAYNETDNYERLFSYDWRTITKAQGQQNKTLLNSDFVRYQNQTETNFGLINWMNSATKQFYYILRTPVDKMTAKGLPYSSDNNSYVRVKVSYCYDPENQSCYDNDTITRLSNFGRFFLFIENKPDTSSVSKEDSFNNGNNYLLYNFFVIPNYYKRVIINFQVIETTVLPDYLTSFSETVTTRLQIQSIFEQLSVVNYYPNNTDAIAFNMQLAPIKLNNRISRSTLIDHVSRWGALWGVLFAVFALFFLRYNREKFYKKNPEWDRFKKALQQKKKNEATMND